MKSTLYLALTLVAVLAANTHGQPVLDINGDPLLPGIGYYVLPIIWAFGGGLSLAGRGSEICPLDIVQIRSEIDNGFPVKFSNWKPKIGFVPESEELNIETVATTICLQPTYWWLDHFDKERKQYFVTTGPKPSGYEKESARSFFKIQKSGTLQNSYKFVSCAPLCDNCTSPAVCNDVGRFIDEKGIRRLAISEEPYNVVFVRNEDDVGVNVKMQL